MHLLAPYLGTAPAFYWSGIARPLPPFLLHTDVRLQPFTAMAARICEELAVLPLRAPVVLAAVLFRKAASTQWACAVSSVCALPLPPLLPLCSQVDYRGKVWVCNFCFSRNAVSCVGGGRRASEGVCLGLRVECRGRGAGSQTVCVCVGGLASVVCASLPPQYSAITMGMSQRLIATL